jgi:hypothetical protein
VAPATPLGLVGEFTPELEDDEVEILCIRLNSAMGDVIPVRARRVDPHTIGYQIADEYDGEYGDGTEFSEEPLTGYEMIELLRGIPSATEDFPLPPLFEQMATFDESERRENPESVAAGQRFVSLQSDFYPDLNPALADWYREGLEEGERRNQNFIGRDGSGFAPKV